MVSDNIVISVLLRINIFKPCYLWETIFNFFQTFKTDELKQNFRTEHI